MQWRRLLTGAALVCALLAVAAGRPSQAAASITMESILMDDDQLIYATPGHVNSELRALKALGIDRIKVSVVWSLVAPAANSTHEPAFDATDPAAYPSGVWNRYDTVVRLAARYGLGVYFQLTAPAPAWAVSRSQPHQGYAWSNQPNPTYFGQFAEAVGRRYSGTYTAADPPAPASGSGGGVTLPVVPITIPPVPGLGGSQPAPSQPAPLPRVSYWGLWNEPNEGAWLNPQWRRGPHGSRILVAPVIYRRMVDAAYEGLAAAGHGSDTILIGETASGGTTTPVPFVRALYCVGGHQQPLTGAAARALSCPASGNRRQFVAQNPGLFHITGYAHHPYGFDAPPTRVVNPAIITLADLPHFEDVLEQIFDAYGELPQGGVPLYLTEYGYKTDPPNPFVRTSLAQQALWLNQSEYLAWQMPYVRALAQFLLVDEPPNTKEPRGSLRYWGTFQTGLIMRGGPDKPGYYAFRIPIWVPHPRHGSRVTVWGELRPADHSGLQYAVLQYQPRGSGWQQLREIQTASPEGFLVAHVAIPAAGNVRLAWPSPAGGVEYSRVVAIK